MSATDLIQRTIAMLDVYAASLRECHNIDPLNPTWEDEEEAQEEHDRLQAAAGELRALATDIQSLQRQLAVETDRAAYGWRNVEILEKFRQEEMTKRDAAQAEAEALRTTMIDLLEILRRWEPDHASSDDRKKIIQAMYQAHILCDPLKAVEVWKLAAATPAPTSESQKTTLFYKDGMPD